MTSVRIQDTLFQIQNKTETQWQALSVLSRVRGNGEGLTNGCTETNLKFGQAGRLAKPCERSELHRGQTLAARLRLQPIRQQTWRGIVGRCSRQLAEGRPIKPGIEVPQKRGGGELTGRPIQQKFTVLRSRSFRVQSGSRPQFRKKVTPTNEQRSVLAVCLRGRRLRGSGTCHIHACGGRGGELKLKFGWRLGE